MDKNYVMALVHAWLAKNPSYYMTWVKPHWQLRYSRREDKLATTMIGGHWRTLALWGYVLRRVRQVCKFEVLAAPTLLEAPIEVRRSLFDENGEFLPKRYRMFIWV